MATLADISASLTEIVGSLTALDLKLDEVKAKIDGLQVGVPVTQEQIDALASALSDIKVQAAKVLAEGTDLATPV